MAKSMQKVDGMAYGVMALGAINSGLIGLARLNMMSKIFRRNSKLMRGAYALIGLTAIYRSIRLLAPKSKHERRLQKLDHALDKIEGYEKQARVYSQTAENYIHKLKKMRPSLAK